MIKLKIYPDIGDVYYVEFEGKGNKGEITEFVEMNLMNVSHYLVFNSESGLYEKRIY